MNLIIEESDDSLEQVAQSVAEVTKDEDVDSWKDVLSGGTEVKWYDVTDDMLRVSLRHPQAVLTLSGEGQENGDKWVSYFKDGKIQAERMPEWTPPPFDPAKLK
ncbi:MAG: hypothetical protein OXD31_17355 [Chloroflexi bacterium]|nr:hypothetical protein [Chloroflexota bacterium]